MVAFNTGVQSGGLGQLLCNDLRSIVVDDLFRVMMGDVVGNRDDMVP